MEIYTIGYAKKTAREFFEGLTEAGIRRLLDVRLHNSSQLAGFTKREDLPYFLERICGIEYLHLPLLAPTEEILRAYKKEKGSWQNYEENFLRLLIERRIEEKIDPGLFATKTVLLCSEPTPNQCHRRLIAEYLREKWEGVKIFHL